MSELCKTAVNGDSASVSGIAALGPSVFREPDGEKKSNLITKLASNGFGADAVFNEFCLRCKKPVCILPNIWNPAKSGMLFSMGVDAICELDWEDTIKQLVVRHARKAISQAGAERAFLLSWFFMLFRNPVIL